MDITGRPALAKDTLGRFSVGTPATPSLGRVVGAAVPVSSSEEELLSHNETEDGAADWQFDEKLFDIEGANNDKPSEQARQSKQKEASGEAKPEEPPRKIAFRIATGLMTMGLVGVLFFTFVTANPKSLSATDSKTSAALGTDMAYIPSIQEETPAATYLTDYKVEGSFPRYISVPALSLTARTIPVGVDGRGQPRLPIHSYDAGWYTVSAKPGEAGEAVISGTCTTPSTKGVFEELHTVSKGEEIIVERGDGVKVRYVVSHIEHVLTADLDMMKLLHTQEGYKTGLSIVTCSGTYNSKTNDMSERIVVYATQI